MTRLPQRELILELRKLEAYCLNLSHPRGRHKARVFREALGITHADASWLRDVLLDAAPQADAVELVNAIWDDAGASTSRSRDMTGVP